MNKERTVRTRPVSAIVAGVVLGFVAGSAYAHCDTMSGPVIPEARAALEKGDVTPILKWVKPDGEEEITAVAGLPENTLVLFRDLHLALGDDGVSQPCGSCAVRWSASAGSRRRWCLVPACFQPARSLRARQRSPGRC